MGEEIGTTSTTNIWLIQFYQQVYCSNQYHDVTFQQHLLLWLRQLHSDSLNFYNVQGLNKLF